MKSVYFAFALSASFILCNSCTSDAADPFEDDVKIEKTFGVSSIDSETRTYISSYDGSEGKYGVAWNTTDKVSIFAEGHSVGDVFDYIEYHPQQHKKALFKGMTYNKTKFWALYPAQQNARLTSDEYLEFTIPSTQKAVKDTFDPAAGIQIGHIENATGDIGLKSVCAYFELTVNANCYSIEVESTPDIDGTQWYLAGTVTADAKSAGAPIKSFGNCVSKITLTDIPADGGTFYIAFIPSNRLPGIKVNINYDQSVGGLMTLNLTPSASDGKFQFLANHIYPLGGF